MFLSEDVAADNNWVYIVTRPVHDTIAFCFTIF